MPKVITTYNGDVKIGAYMFVNSKKPKLCIESGNRIVPYGIFNNVESADSFMNKLGEFLGAKKESED